MAEVPMKVKFIPLQGKIILFFAILLVLSLTLVGTLTYRSILTSNIEPLVGKRMDYSARGIALTIPGEKYKQLVSAYVNHPQNLAELPELAQIQRFLQVSQRQNELTSPVQTLIKDPKDPKQVVVLATSNEESHEVAHLPMDPWVSRVFKEGLPIFTPIYSKLGGLWISGLAPIETEQGEIAGVIQVEYDASQEVHLAKIDILGTLLKAGMMGFALALGLGIFFGRTLTRPLKNLSLAAFEVSRGNLNPKIDVSTHDEIGTLARTFKKMISEIRANRKSLEDYSKNLEEKVKERTREVKEANQKISAMLDSLGQGFFLFQADGTCLPIHSKACLQLLEGSPEGKALKDYLRNDMNGDLGDWVKALFTETLPFESLAPLGLRKFPHSQGLMIDLDYQAIRNDDHQVQWVMTIATDRTTENQAREAAEKEKARSKRILLLMENRSQFLSFNREVNQILESSLKLLEEKSPNLLLEMKRGLHTIKGGAALFRFNDLVNLIQQQEDEIAAIDTHGFIPNETDLRLKDILESIKRELNKSLFELRPILGPTLDSGVKLYSHSETELLQILQESRTAGISKPVLENWEVQLLHEPILRGFKHFNEVVTQAAETSGKRILPLEFHGGELKLYLKAYERLLSALVHAFRNAVDHGIENPSTRIERGKPESGKIQVAFKFLSHPLDNGDSKHLQIQIKDDGSGIDAAQIRSKLKLRNPIDPRLSDDDTLLYQVLFESGLSTKTEVTRLSGRGVGLDAVYHEATLLGGSARLDSKFGQWTCLTLEVPVIRAL